MCFVPFDRHTDKPEGLLKKHNGLRRQSPKPYLRSKPLVTLKQTYVRPLGILPKARMWLPFGQYIIVPKKKIGHNPQGTTLEPLGIFNHWAFCKQDGFPGRRRKPDESAELGSTTFTVTPPSSSPWGRAWYRSFAVLFAEIRTGAQYAGTC